MGERRGKSVGFGLLGGVAATLLSSCCPLRGAKTSSTWLVDKYAATLSGYPHATLSTGNLMFLLGGNWRMNRSRSSARSPRGQIGLVLMALSFAAGVAVHAVGRGRSLSLRRADDAACLCAGYEDARALYPPALALLFSRLWRRGISGC